MCLHRAHAVLPVAQVGVPGTPLDRGHRAQELERQVDALGVVALVSGPLLEDLHVTYHLAVDDGNRDIASEAPSLLMKPAPREIYGDPLKRPETPFSLMAYDRSTFSIIAWQDLPAPGWLFKCAHKNRYPHNEDPRVAFAAFPAFVASLSAKEVAACPHHAYNIALVCQIAVASLREQAVLDDGLIELVAMRDGADEHEVARAQSMLHQPIRYSASTRMYTNGQHRACALIAARVEECAVQIGE